MNDILRGKVAIKLGDIIGADEMVPAEYMWENNVDVLARVCLTQYEPTFPDRVKPGDFVVAGQNFGYGHLHLSGLYAFQRLGLSCVIAESFTPGWYRGAVGAGFLVVVCREITKHVDAGDELEVNLKTGVVRNLTDSISIQGDPVPPLLREILDAGGMPAYAAQKVP